MAESGACAVGRSTRQEAHQHHLDAAIIDHFKATAGERGYQTLINETLRKAVAGETLVTELRSVLREELATYKVR